MTNPFLQQLMQKHTGAPAKAESQRPPEATPPEATRKPSEFPATIRQGAALGGATTLPTQTLKSDGPNTQSIPKTEEKKSLESENKGLTNPKESGIDISPPANEKVNEPMLTPQAQRLLGGPAEPTTPDVVRMNLTDEPVASGIHELATLETDSLEAQEKRELNNLNAKAAELAKKITLQSTESVRAVCDALDRRLEAVGGAALEGPALIESRNFVQALMVTLKTRPEFEEVLIDKDVRNIFKYIRATREESLAVRELKQVKRETRSQNATKKTKQTTGMAAAFAQLMGAVPDMSKLGD